MDIKLIHGDCFEVLKTMPDKSVDLVVTDPPYGINFRSNRRIRKHNKIVGDDKYPVGIIDEFKRVAKRGIYIFCRWDNLYDLPKPKSVIVWVKNVWTMGDLKHEHGRQWEAIAFYNLEEHQFIKRIPDVIFAKKTNNELHPTQKPVELIEKIIGCNVGNLIFDPFMGSGTTGVACKKLNRSFIGVEIDPHYFKIAKERINSIPDDLFSEETI